MINNIFILDRGLNTKMALTVNGKNTFFDDIYNMNLSTGTESYEFSTNAEGIDESDYVMFHYKDQYKLFQITEIEQEHSEGKIITSIYGECACLELINGVSDLIINNANNSNEMTMDAIQFIEHVLAGSQWQIGNYSTSLLEKNAAVKIDKPTQRWTLIQDYMGAFGYEINTRVKYENGFVKAKLIDIYAEGELGEVTHKRFEYGRNVRGITKKKNLYDFCTALILDTKHNTLPAKVDNVKGYVKYENIDIVYATDNNRLYNSGVGYIHGIYSDNDAETPGEVIENAIAELKKRSVPKFDYECDTALTYDEYRDISIGDTVYVIDHSFNPIITLEARVGELEISFTDRDKCKCNLSNYKEIKSKIDVKLTAGVKDIINTYFPLDGGKIAGNAISPEHLNTTMYEHLYTEIVEANIGQFKELVAESFVANEAYIGDLEVIRADILELDAKKATIEQLEVTEANIEELNTRLLNADKAIIEKLDAAEADITKLNADVANIGDLKADRADLDRVEADVANIDELKADKAIIEQLRAEIADIDELKADKATIDELNAKVGNVEKLTAEKASIEELNALRAEIDDLDVEDLSAIRADIVDLKAGKADITELNAAVGKVDMLESDIADINTVISDHLSSDNINSLVINAIKTTTEEAIIKDALIESVDAGKINAGEINTGKVTLQSNDGGMTLTGSLLQFRDEREDVRIQMGKDNNGKFSFAIYDEYGSGQLITHEGIQASNAIKDGIIIDQHIEHGTINGDKLNINTVINRINKDGTESLLSNKIKLDEGGQTLDLAFNELTSTVTDTQSKTKMNTTSIQVAQGQIETLITETENIDLELGFLTSRYNNTVQTVDKHSTTIGLLETKDNEIISKQSEFEVTLSGFSSRVDNAEYVIQSGIKSATTEFYLSDSPTEFIGGEWVTYSPDWVSGKYVWQRIKYEYIGGAIVYGNVICVTGAKGEQGEKGEDGTSVKILGSYNSLEELTAAHPDNEIGDGYIINGDLYVWSGSAFENVGKIQGPQGEQGIQGVPGPAGKDGTTYYTWIRYADDAYGSGISNDPTGKKYIGFAYNKTTDTESSFASDYTWTKIVGEKGDQGIQGPAGADGTSTYTWIKYSDYADGTALYDTPKDSTKYIGIATNKDTATESTSKADYVWSLFRGADGADGEPGEKGDPGEPGEPGKDGEKGQSLVSSTPQWILSESSTEPPANNAEWLDSMPTISDELFLWVRYKQVWENPANVTYTTPVLEQISEAVKEGIVKTATLEQTLDGFSATVTELNTTVADITDKQASLDLSVNGFVTEVRESYYTKNDTDSLIDGVNSSTGQRITAAESSIKQLADSISTLVVDEKGSSLMTQTSNGWVFNMSEINKTLENASKELGELSGNVDEFGNTLSNIDGLINDLSQKTAYITMSTDDQGNPCIELGRANDEFKVRITNTAIEFMEGTNKVAYVNNQSLYIEKAVVKNELQIGEDPGWAFAKRKNGNLGLRWKGSGN